MKKIISVFLCLLFVLTTVGCQTKNEEVKEVDYPSYEAKLKLNSIYDLSIVNRDVTFTLLDDDIVDVDYELYGNLDGQYPVENKVLGNINKENLSLVNSNGIKEIVISSHGQGDNIDQAYFENGMEKRRSLVNMSNINDVLSDNSYYLDCWTCENAYDLKNDIATKVLEGQCVGIFAATHIIPNNGVDCRANEEKMKAHNFYYFYYNYLYALNEGLTKSEAFCYAQQKYIEENMKCKEATGDELASYEFNLCNALAYQNLGVIEPNIGYIATIK